MIDVEFFALCVVAVLSFLAGVLAGRQRRSEHTAVKPICHCEHPIGHHEDKTGRCLAQVERTHYGKNGGRNGYEYVACACQHYTGPELISTFAVREIATDEEKP